MQLLATPRTWLNALKTALLCIGLASTTVQAGQVLSRFGSQDGFGINVQSGATFEFIDLTAPTTEGTDQEIDGGISGQLTSLWSGTLISAQLQVFSGGWGRYGPAEVLLNGTVIGQLTVGDFDTLGANYAFLDSFDLGAGLGLINGVNAFDIRVAPPTASTDPLDTGVLGFLKLTLQTQDSGPGNTVTEPASLALAGLALAAALARRRGQGREAESFPLSL